MSDPGALTEILQLQQAVFRWLSGIGLSTQAVALYALRFAVALQILPVTADQVVNRASRTGLAVLLAAYVAMGRPMGEVLALSGAQMAMVVVKEAALGLALGFAMSTVFWTIEFAGALVDNAAGYNSVQLQNPMSGQQSTPVSNLMGKLAGAVFFSIGGGMFFAQTLFESFRAWPLADLHPSAEGAYAVFMEMQVNALFANTVKLAAPVLTVLVLVDTSIGLLSRSAEKLEPTSLSQPIKGVVTIVLVLLMVGALFDTLKQYLVPRCLVCQMTPDRVAPAPAR